jgi:hypothetical protein
MVFPSPLYLMPEFIGNLMRQTKNCAKKEVPQLHLIEAPPSARERMQKGAPKHNGAFPSATILSL